MNPICLCVIPKLTFMDTVTKLLFKFALSYLTLNTSPLLIHKITLYKIKLLIMKSNKGKPTGILPDKPDLYSPQFEYKDLYNRLSKIKQTRKKSAKPKLYSSFDLSFIPGKPLKNLKSKKRRPNDENIIKITVKNEKYKAPVKLTHRRNLTDQFLQTDMIPLFSPGFSIYHCQVASKSRRYSIGN